MAALARKLEKQYPNENVGTTVEVQPLAKLDSLEVVAALIPNRK